MFERYTEKARRVIFFARYEASHFGSPYIESEHMLLGLLREDKALTNRFMSNDAAVESFRKQVEGHIVIRDKISTAVDLPLSNESKRILGYAAEEAERMTHLHIGTEHILLGILREEECFAAEMLDERGVRLEAIRAEIAAKTVAPAFKARIPALESASVSRPQAALLFAIHLVDTAGNEIHPTIRTPLPGGVPRIGETFSLAHQDEPERIFRVQNVHWNFTLQETAFPLQTVTLTLEPAPRENPLHQKQFNVSQTEVQT